MIEKEAKKEALRCVFFIDLLMILTLTFFIVYPMNHYSGLMSSMQISIILTIIFIVSAIIMSFLTYFGVYKATLIKLKDKESVALVIDKLSTDETIEVIPIKFSDYDTFFSGLLNSCITKFTAKINHDNDNVTIFIQIGTPERILVYSDKFEEVAKEDFATYYKLKEIDTKNN